LFEDVGGFCKAVLRGQDIAEFIGPIDPPATGGQGCVQKLDRPLVLAQMVKGDAQIILAFLKGGRMGGDGAV
jgi:hypothetical protein